MARETEPSSSPSPVVLIAASAGGVEALSTIIRDLPDGFPAPIVIVLHRPAKSRLVSVLARASALPVDEARPGQVMKPGVIYVARSEGHLTVDADRTFRYVDGRRIRHVRSSANPLFATSADVFGPRAIAVVLTGSGMDGTDGVQAIKARGGTVIAQDQLSSAFFHMPSAAIKTGVVDYVIPLPEIAPTLVRLLADSEMAPNLRTAHSTTS